MDRTRIPAAAFEWAWVSDDGKRRFSLRADPVHDILCAPFWDWAVEYYALPLDLQAASVKMSTHTTGRNLSDTPQDALDSLSDEQMDILEKLIDWVRGEG